MPACQDQEAFPDLGGHEVKALVESTDSPGGTQKEGTKEKGEGFRDGRVLGQWSRVKEVSRLLERAALHPEHAVVRMVDPVRVLGRKRLVAPEQFQFEHTGQLLTSLFLVRTASPVDGAE